MVKLEENYRSTQNILAANSVISNNTEKSKTAVDEAGPRRKGGFLPRGQ